MECPICYDPIETTRNCVTTDCGHKFHASCLMKHSQLNGFSCPLCRTQMVENENDEEDPVYDDEIHQIEDDEILRMEEERYDILRGWNNESRTDELQRQQEQMEMHDDVLDFQHENSESNDEAPPIEYISEQLVTRGITIDNLVAASLRTNSNYNKNMRNLYKINDVIAKHIYDIICEYTMSQQPNASYE